MADVKPPPPDERAPLAHLRAVLTTGITSAIDTRVAGVTAESFVAALATLPPAVARRCLAELPEATRVRVQVAATPALIERLAARPESAEGTVGRLMREPIGVVPDELAAGQAVELVKRTASADLTYLYAVDLAGRLTGVVVLRDLFLARVDQAVRELMIRPVFFLTPEMTILEAMHAVVDRHFPVYPVCAADGTLLGLVRGYVLFENQVITITAQAGKLVGVPASDRTGATFASSLRVRLPWLVVNLALSLASAVVLLAFRETMSRFIILAVFLTVVATQGRNAGAQTMALVLRGLTGGTWHTGMVNAVLRKEIFLGATGGALVGLLAAVAIWIEEWWMGNPAALLLAATVLVGMVFGCAASCAAGVAMPLVLRRLGFDPALAAGILLTNLCTVSCQALFLALAVWWLP